MAEGLTPRSPAGEVVLGYVRDQVAAISRYDPLVRRDEPDAVHQMRVATRRARSAQQAFGGVLGWEEARSLCAELKWLAATLGQARDGEVMLDRLTADLAELQPGDQLPTVAALAKRYHVSTATVAKALGKLKDEGLIVSRHGWGTHVSGSSPRASG